MGALIAAGFDPDQPTAWALEGLLPYLPGAAQDALFERMHKLSAVGSQIAAELGPESGEVQEFADNMPAISQDGTQPPVADLWYDDPRANTKGFLVERHWKVTNVDLVDKAANEHGRPFQGLPPIFDRLLRTKFLHRHPRTLNRRIDLTALVLARRRHRHRSIATPHPRQDRVTDVCCGCHVTDAHCLASGHQRADWVCES